MLLSNGFSSIGDYIYLVAINIIILEKTNSLLAVSCIWIIPYISSILTKFWSGSITDRYNKKKMMILANIVNGLILFSMANINSIMIIYILIFLLNISIAILGSVSLPYTTENIPQDQRKRFNSIQGMLTNGSIVIGPAISAFILRFSNGSIAIIVNAITFFASAIFLSFMPKIHKKVINKNKENIKAKLINDWKDIYDFMLRKNLKFTILNLLFIIIVSMGVALDSQEVVFAKKILNLNYSQYSLLFMIAGVGYVCGSAFVIPLLNKVSSNNLLKIGSIFSAIGFIIYSTSTSFIMAMIGFFILGFFQSQFNTGYLTRLQETVPLDILGRIFSSISFFQSIVMITFMILIGLLSNYFGIKYVIIISTFLILIISIVMASVISFSELQDKRLKIKD
ncbi:MFS transporter [Clostridium akagii]|uniref:MFS transporter n=1 Tax=Clostridium akagii TaxID=91623 RepID=UPI00047B1AF8|nr:MFS transporter [Clostridium akagii]